MTVEEAKILIQRASACMEALAGIDDPAGFVQMAKDTEHDLQCMCRAEGFAAVVENTHGLDCTTLLGKRIHGMRAELSRLQREREGLEAQNKKRGEACRMAIERIGALQRALALAGINMPSPATMEVLADALADAGVKP